ncbi:MAG: galactose mutarotase [Sphingobacteriales bacterium]|nr:galactose mutarotase [Sphingobacteriales bacterium]
MAIQQQVCSTTASGQQLIHFTLRNEAGTEVKITNYGAIITSFSLLQADGTRNDIVLGFDSVEAYRSDEYLGQYPYFGCVIGRCANRIKDAVFEIDGTTYPVTPNFGTDQLHGGLTGFDKKIWELVSFGSTPSPFVEMKYLSPDGEEGYPGNLEISIRFELTDDNELSYAFTGTTDKPTAVNLTHHGYFNLNNGKGDIRDYELKIYGSQVLDQDEKLCTTGSLTAVKDTVFDFRSFTRIGDRLNEVPEFDKSFVVDKNHDPSGLALMAEVRCPASKLLLQVYATDPVVHFYTGKWIPALKGKNNTVYGPFSALCLETQIHPNAINIPHFPAMVLRPGDVYRSKTVYKLIG